MWKHLFKKHILDRGYAYLCLGRIEDIQYEGDIVTAKVQGTDNYTVLVRMKGPEIADMKCDCPYATDGNNCKHMAALLYYLGSLDEAKKNEENLLLIRKLVTEADTDLIRDFLINILHESEKLFEIFKLKSGLPFSPEDIQRYKNQVDSVFWDKESDDENDFFRDEDAWTATMEITDLLEDTVNAMVESGHYREAIDLANYIYLKTGNSQMDGSQGGNTMIADACLEIWEETLSHCDSQLKKAMFQWFLDHMDDKADENMGNRIELVLFDSFKEEEYAAAKKSLLKATIDDYREKGNGWLIDQRLGQLTLLYLDFLYEQKASQDEIANFYESNLDVKEVKDRLIAQHLSDEKYQKAIVLLKKAKKEEQAKLWESPKYSLILKDVYKTIKESELYKRELWSLVLSPGAVNLDLYKELKSLYSEKDWAGKREKIFTALSGHYIAYELFSYEKMYDRLLSLVLDSPGFDKLLQYEGVLLKTYPDELLQKYETELIEMASYSSGRPHYRKIAFFLKQMKKYPGGPEKVARLMDDWRIKYKNRPAMMDELSD